MTTRELFNRWFRNKKKVPVFNEDVDIVCKANQIMTEDGKSVEDMLKEGSGGGALKLTLIGTPIVSGENLYYNITPDEDIPENYVPTRETPNPNWVAQSEINAILNAPEITLIKICSRTARPDGETALDMPVALGCSFCIDKEVGCTINQQLITNYHTVEFLDGASIYIDLTSDTYGRVYIMGLGK